MDPKGSNLESWLLTGWNLNMMALWGHGLDEGHGDLP